MLDALVGVAATVGVDEFEVVALLFDEELDEALAVAPDVALVVAVVFFFVVLLVVAAFGFGDVAGAAVVTDEFVVAGAVVVAAVLPGNEVAAEAPAKVEIEFDPNCGGVTDRTAPRPPTVPPAISNARFMPHLFFFSY